MASALHLIVHISRLFDGSRRVTHVTEVSGMEGAIITMQDIFVFNQEGITADGRVIGELRPTGLRPHFTDRLKAFGIDITEDIFGVGRWA